MGGDTTFSKGIDDPLPLGRGTLIYSNLIPLSAITNQYAYMHVIMARGLFFSMGLKNAHHKRTTVCMDVLFSILCFNLTHTDDTLTHTF